MIGLLKNIIRHVVGIVSRVPYIVTHLPQLMAQFIKDFPENFKKFRLFVLDNLGFWALFIVFFLNLFIGFVYKSRFCPRFLAQFLLKASNKVASIARVVDRGQIDGIRHLELFEMSYRNMLFKKARTMVTVGGMALGVATIVFLVSLGYGLQNMVVGRVARLDEMKQTDVSTQPGSQARITDDTLKAFKEIPGVSKALPLIGVVAKVNYQGSITDVAVYGVTTDYLENSAIRPRDGKLFDSREIGHLQKWDDFVTAYNQQVIKDENAKDVAGASTLSPGINLKNTKVRDVKYSIYPKIWVKLREAPSLSSKVIGFTRRAGGIQYGEEYWGDKYVAAAQPDQNSSGDKLYGRWISAKVYVWEEIEDCSKESRICEDGRYAQMLDDKGDPLQRYVYFDESTVQVKGKDMSQPEVLAETDDDTSESTGGQPIVNGEGLLQDDLDFIGLTIESTPSSLLGNVKKVKLPDDAQREAVVNEAFIKVLGLDTESPIGKAFNVSFIVTSDLLGDDSAKVESEDAEYNIVGVIPGDNTPFFYAPVKDLKKLGVTNYSQIKLVVENKEDLADVREKVRAMGFSSESVADTVEQINNLFNSIRVVLAVIGGVALGVASLGMFNTLTVSLLERTREVGLMKAMGMTSEEVKKLFLVESMLMGFIGGVSGIIIGAIAGKVFSAMLSVVSVARGVGVIDISFVPMNFVLLVFGLSLVVGTVTGIYPARRARKISALDAIRYE